MSKKEIVNDINLILAEKDIDERIKPFLKLYFLGKLKNEEISLEEIISQIDILVSRIKNVEFVSGDALVVAYEKKANVLSINKDLILSGKSDEVILPLFMKFEEALNFYSRSTYSNHIEDYINAGRIATSLSLPISDRLYRLYEMAESCYGSIGDKESEYAKDGSWCATCDKYNDALNYMIISGMDDREALLNGLNIFHYEVYTSELFKDPNFLSPFNTEEYQIKAAKILACIEMIKEKEEILTFLSPNDKFDKLQSLKNNVMLFTSCSEERIEFAKHDTRYQGNIEISKTLEEAQRDKKPQLTEEYIVNRVQEVIDRKPKWDSRVKHLVIPFFIRSQIIYSWDIDEFNERLNKLDLEIDEIVFEDLESLDEMGGTAVNKIKLNSRVFLDSKR